MDPRLRLILPPVAPLWRGFAIRRGVYCRYLNNNAITAIPTGLFEFTAALYYLYGRPRPNMGRTHTDQHRHLGRPPPFSATASPFPPACSDRPVSALCRDVNRAVSRSAVVDLYYPHVAPLWRCFAICRGVYCRHLNYNAITAIPTGLFNFTTKLAYLYGCPRPAMGRGRPPVQAPRSPGTILGNRIALPSCVL